MSDKEKNAISELAKMFDKLPADKQQYFNGYANGVADMAAKADESSNKEESENA